MKFSERWLREYASPPGDTAALVHQLTMQGLEVEAVEPVAPPLPQVVVGRVIELAPHPNAERLRVCRVDAGAGLLQIVCGAANVRVGGVYPVALVGARLPDGMAIKPAKLRGVASEGMLCSATELGLADQADGLLELDAGLSPGTPVVAALGLDDQILDLKITPNRADCFCVTGVARDLAAATSVPFTEPMVSPVPSRSSTVIAVRVDDVGACPRFATRVIRGLRPSAGSPLWLRERLRRSGIRAIHPVVDVTNYVMLEVGQPLHAYDLDTVAGGLVVRRARQGERLRLLTGDEVELDESVLVIADESGAVGMAGIMGGATTGVSPETLHIVFESAFFQPGVIAGRARRFGLQTDAATRFERGVDPAGQVRAIERATELLLSIAGGEPGPSCLVGSHVDPQMPAVALRRDRLTRVLGHVVADAEVEGILRRLGMQVQPEGEGWQVTPPSFRFDIAIEVDLIEEIARVQGYDRIPERAGGQMTRLGAAPAAAVPLDRVRSVLVERGYQEALTYSFVARDMDRSLAGGSEGVPLINPISAELAVMRQTLWAGLVSAVRYNLARQQSRVRLFEAGVRFVPDGTLLREEGVIAGIATGTALPEQWDFPNASVGFFDVKADVEALVRLGGTAANFSFVAAEHPALQPGRTARILRDDVHAGWLGVLHPALSAAFDLPEPPVLFELDAASVLRSEARRSLGLSRFPAVRRDVAVLVAREVPVARLLDAIAETAGPVLRETVVFDIFAGDRIDPGQKSVALGLILQETSRTLTESEIEQIVGGVVERLAKDFSARIRE